MRISDWSSDVCSSDLCYHRRARHPLDGHAGDAGEGLAPRQPARPGGGIRGVPSMYDFTHHRPASVDDAVKALAGASDGKFMAGGMTLIPTLKQRLASPSDLVDLGGIRDLKGIREDGGKLVIGAMTTHATVARDATVRAKIPALAHLADGIGDSQVRNRGTIGGSIANNDPAADYPAGLVGLGATVQTRERKSTRPDSSHQCATTMTPFV